MKALAIAPAKDVGALLVGGDWASAHGDFGTLRHVAGQLAERVEEPLRCECQAIAECCCNDPDAACSRWARLREAARPGGKDT